MKLLFDRLSATLERNLDYRLERSNVIAANLANADTPGYTPVDMRFDEQLEQVLRGEETPTAARTHGRHAAPATPSPRAEMFFDPTAIPDEDGNGVDLDREMTKLAENQMLYQASTKAFTKRMALLKYAIAEGNR